MWSLALTSTAMSIAMSMALMLGGCVFDQLQRSNENDIHRVEQKQATLKTEEDRSSRLKQQEDELLAELGERQFSLSELNDRVEQLQVENGRAIAQNVSRRSDYADLMERLHQSNAQLASLQHATDSSTEQRRERIDYLKAQVKAQLQLLLH
jgi:predicted nuclease with TOPRIM domain